MKFYPELVLSAMRSNAGGVRLYCIAKHRDTGNGHLPIDEFKQYCKRYLAIPKARFNRWLGEALRLGIIKRSANVYSLVSWGKAAVALGVDGLQTPVEVGVTKIAGEGWKAWVWAAYVKRFENKPIARATLRKLTGVPERNQVRYEAEAGVENQANYANYGPPERNPGSAITEETNGWFWYYGQQKKRMPNSRTVQDVERCKRGRTAKHNSFIRAALSMWGSSQTEKQRIYFRLKNKAQALQALEWANQAKKADALAMFKSSDANQKAEAMAILRNMATPAEIIAGIEAKAAGKTLRAMRKTERVHVRWLEALYLHSCDVMGVSLWEALPC